MANYRTFALGEEILVEPRNFRDVLRGLVHTVNFVRQIGDVEPVEEEIPNLGLSYVRVKHEALYDEVERYVGDAWMEFQRLPNRRADVVVLLYTEQGRFIFKTETTREKWMFRVRVAKADLSEEERAECKATVASHLDFVLLTAGEHQDHLHSVPSPKDAQTLMFQCKVKLQTPEAEAREEQANVVRQILSNPPRGPG